MKRGDVVELNWQFSDLTSSKVRPAVVVQADYLNGLIDDTILVKITGSKFAIPGTEVQIDPAVETISGLSKVCYASCKDILTRDQALVLRTIDVLSDALMQRIEDCLKQVLVLP
jgi:mRNA-degrading endonuclease toxin of MazEF toxin-antitoxin module